MKDQDTTTNRESIIDRDGMRTLLFLLLSIVFIDFIVYFTGGTGYAFTHLMYIPIIISCYLYGVKGGVHIALVAGILLGPFMPVNVSRKLMQEPVSWLIRTAIFILIGFLVGYLFQKIKKDRQAQIEKSQRNEVTGLPNAAKLKLDLLDLVAERRNVTLIAFKITNLEQINRNVDYLIGEKSIFKLIEVMEENFLPNLVYSTNDNQLVATMPECSMEEAYIKANRVTNIFKEPVLIDDLPVRIMVRCGITNYPMHAVSVADLCKKTDMTLDQYNPGASGISIYNDTVTQKNKGKYETVLSLHNAIKHNEFSIVYQPKIDMKSGGVMGVEALLRWNNAKNMSPAEFIKIAEDTEIINDITRWVIKNVVDQSKKWQDDNIKIKISINISANDLKDNSIIEYTRAYIEENHLAPEYFEFEITERSLLKNENTAAYLLNYIKSTGMKISLDDFGTGYNSLIHILRLPIDYVKIDKTLIDSIQDETGFVLVAGIIRIVHILGKEIIAEGLETEEQVAMLNNMKCDHVQGYYFSKPLSPDEAKQFILNCKR